jgi:hypothetical protein
MAWRREENDGELRVGKDLWGGFLTYFLILSRFRVVEQRKTTKNLCQDNR